MPLETVIFIYTALLLGGVTILTVLAQLRRRRFRPAQSEDRVFRCENCGQVYTDDPDVDRSRCAQCGQLNEPIEF